MDKSGLIPVRTHFGELVYLFAMASDPEPVPLHLAYAGSKIICLYTLTLKSMWLVRFFFLFERNTQLTIKSRQNKYISKKVGYKINKCHSY